MGALHMGVCLSGVPEVPEVPEVVLGDCTEG